MYLAAASRCSKSLLPVNAKAYVFIGFYIGNKYAKISQIRPEDRIRPKGQDVDK